MAQLVNLLVYISVLLDIGIGMGEISLRLVIVIIADKVFYRTIRKELLELGAELSCQCLVVTDDQGRPAYPLNNVSHGEGLPAAGNPQQRLVLKTPIQPRHQLVYSLWLVTHRSKIGGYFKLRHTQPFPKILLE